MTPAPASPTAFDLPARLGLILLLVVLAVGAGLRVKQSVPIRQLGFDEGYYTRYATALAAGGLGSYPEIARAYVVAQRELPHAVIPPMRVMYQGLAWLVQRIFGVAPPEALRAVSCLFTILTLVVTAGWVTRMAGWGAGVAVTALMSCAPLQIQMAQRIYIDGFFAFWATFTLWTLWENLRAPNRRGWLALYGFALAGMVMSKENAAFVFVAVLAILGVNRWAAIGQITPALRLVTAAGPALGAAVLLLAAGSLSTLIEVYRLNVTMTYAIPYVIRTGDGPWHRYVLDLLTLSPVVTLLAIGGLFHSVRSGDKRGVYLALFVLCSYVIMANLRYGINLRYSTVWDLPLRWFTFILLTSFGFLLPGRFRPWALALAVVLICGLELRGFFRFFVQHGLYDPVPEPMLRILQILK